MVRSLRLLFRESLPGSGMHRNAVNKRGYRNRERFSGDKGGNLRGNRIVRNSRANQRSSKKKVLEKPDMPVRHPRTPAPVLRPDLCLSSLSRSGIPDLL
jgi:hypothetical protein